jgi:conjugative relaxase-like TrwC/TraI family protein
LVATFAVIKSSSYYTRQAAAAAVDYYAADDSAGIWLRGHDALGIVAGDIVRADDFDRICSGLDPAGRQLTRAAGGPRMLGIDMTLSAPKSFSAKFACADGPLRQLLAEVEYAALEDVVRLVEREIPLARRGSKGARREHATFVAAVFTHSEARPERHADGAVFADPQRHHHVCIPNIAERPDGSWGGVDSVALRSWKKALGAVFRLRLASGLQAHGFVIEHTDDEWKWSIAGVPQTVTQYFSARRATLEEVLADAGLTSGQAPALAAAINATDRRNKQDLSLDELTAQWHAAVRRLGYEPEQIAQAGQSVEQASVDLGVAREERLARIPEKLTEHEATFSRRELLEVSANALIGTAATLDDVIIGADELIAGDHVLERAETRDGPVYTTPQMLAAERALVALVRRNAQARAVAPDQDARDRMLADSGLNSEQQEVVRAATSGARLTLVQGGAGTGKSTTLKTVATVWQHAGYQVVGAAVAWRAASILAADLGIESRAIDAWSKSVAMGNRPFGPKTCLIVEEAGLQSTLQTLQLLEAVDRTGGVVVMVGDENQLVPIGAGHAIRLVRETIGAARIDTVVRQREAWARQAPKDFAHGRAQKALDAFSEHDQITFQDSPRAAVDAVADRWIELASVDPARTILVTAKTNAEVRALSAAIRSRLQERGAITGPEFSIEAADSSGNRHTLRLAIGDQVRFLRRHDELGVVNGTEARIVGIEQDEAGTLRIEAERGGERISFSPADVADNKGRVRLAHAAATTLFQAQGLTVDHSLVLLSPRLDRHDAYVASSRARESTEFFIDARTLDREIEQDAPRTANEDRDKARMTYLAGRLARQSIKTNALDYVPAQEPARVRQKELDHEL